MISSGYAKGERVRIAAPGPHHGRTGHIAATGTDDSSHLLVVRMDDDGSLTYWHWVRSLERLPEDEHRETPVRVTLVFPPGTFRDGFPGPIELIDGIAENHDSLKIAMLI